MEGSTLTWKIGNLKTKKKGKIVSQTIKEEGMSIKEKEQRQELELIFFVKEKLVALRVSM